MIVAGVPLYPVPRIVLEACQQAQELTSRTVLCPTLLPRPSVSSNSQPGLAPQPIGVVATDDPNLLSSGTGPGSVLLNFTYNAPYENDPTKNRPDRFLHFEVFIRGACCGPAPGAQPAVLGGKSGLLVRAGVAGAYFGNHVRFFWSQGGIDYVATLHEFGAGTTALLGALVSGLQPVERVAATGSPTTPVIRRMVPVPRMTGPVAVTVSRDSIWVASIGDAASAYRTAAWPGRQTGPGLQRFDAGTLRPVGEAVRLVQGRKLQRLGLTEADWRPLGLASGFGRVWTVVSFPGPTTLFGLDPATGQITAKFRIPSESTKGDITGIAAAGGALWVSQYGPARPGHEGEFGGIFDPGSVWRIDPETGAVTARIEVGAGAVSVAGTTDAVWVANYLDDTVSRMDPATNLVVATIPVGAGPTSIAATPGTAWVTNSLDGTVSRIDATTNRVVDIRVGEDPMGVAASGDGVWVTNYSSDTVSRIDPHINRVVATAVTGRGPIAIAEDAQHVWITNDLDATLEETT
jgi:YVTN family beta-propeller protein